MADADSGRAAAFAELTANECGDEIQREALARACDILATSAHAARLDRLDVVVVDPVTASAPLKQSPYYTHACAALLAESAIAVNLSFLAEVEAVIRTFASAGSMLAMPQLGSDAAMYDLVRRLRPDPWPQLRRLRRLSSGYGAPTRDGDREIDLRHELALVALFFLAHEVGHLLDGKDERSFASFLSDRAEFEVRVADAVVRLARHVQDLHGMEHGLPGFEAVNDPSSEVGATIAEMTEGLGPVAARHDGWFDDERSADSWADRLLGEHLDTVAAADEHDAAKAGYLLCRGVFAAGLFSWYGDLLVLLDHLSADGLSGARTLAFEMMRDHGNYIRAASLFGDVHRCTLLRAELALGAVIEHHSDWFSHMRWTRGYLDATGPEDDTTSALRSWWLEESVLRWCLLGLVLDTAVKLAYVGAAGAWIGGRRQEGLPQKMLVMQFDPIDVTVARLGKHGRSRRS